MRIKPIDLPDLIRASSGFLWSLTGVVLALGALFGLWTPDLYFLVWLRRLAQ
jgi:hypothetical protein